MKCFRSSRKGEVRCVISEKSVSMNATVRQIPRKTLRSLHVLPEDANSQSPTYHVKVYMNSPMKIWRYQQFSGSRIQLLRHFQRRCRRPGGIPARVSHSSPLSKFSIFWRSLSSCEYFLETLRHLPELSGSTHAKCMRETVSGSKYSSAVS
ncbi:hypothetical protein K402DRAFT_264588 [Aulographum hederae CBS 113979]|uniref:Uncharacterized protein n=1 Tax=Aulographum hederae CBS 113979 TaxID=1176131 RepID=A0A6G1H9W1_9PEZI|nr:hypothetical protein K402DRAFT_264588 [Aulographum hederae CBS 113979]